MLRKLFGVRSTADADPVQTAFGSLEREVMDVLWAAGDLAVREVQTRLPRDVAYTTVMTTLDRLFKKGILSRRRSGRAFRYSPALTRAELQTLVAGRVLSSLLQAREGVALPVLSNLVESVGAEAGGAELLERLEAMIKAKRRALRPPSSRSTRPTGS